jgi:hypothetical protein
MFAHSQPEKRSGLRGKFCSDESPQNLNPRKYSIRFVFLLSVVFFLTSCVTVSEIPESRRNHIIDNVPFYPGGTDQCGPVSLATVLNYQGVSVTPEEISRAVFSESAGGTLNIDMLVYPRKKGMHSEQYKGSMDDVRRNIQLGNPLIVLVDYGFSFYQKNHFMVIVGYNENGVIVNSGDERDKFIREEDFSRIWSKTNFWTLLIKKE